MRLREIPEPAHRLVKFGGVAIIVALVGAGIAALAAIVAVGLVQDIGNGIGDLIAAVVSLLVGYPCGVCIGVVLVKRLLRWSGSVPFGIVAALLGAGLTMVLAEPLHLNVNTEVLMSVYSVTVAVCAAGGFTLSRHGKGGVLPS